MLFALAVACSGGMDPAAWTIIEGTGPMSSKRFAVATLAAVPPEHAELSVFCSEGREVFTLFEAGISRLGRAETVVVTFNGGGGISEVAALPRDAGEIEIPIRARVVDTRYTGPQSANTYLAMLESSETLTIEHEGITGGVELTSFDLSKASEAFTELRASGICMWPK